METERQYETTIVIDSFSKDEDIKNLINKIQSFIKNNGGRIDEIQEWGKRRLAYEINRKQYGNYVHIRFTGPGTIPQLLEREYRLEESILRYLTVLTDPRTLAESEEQKSEPEKASTEEVKDKGRAGDAVADSSDDKASGEESSAEEPKQAPLAEQET